MLAKCATFLLGACMLFSTSGLEGEYYTSKGLDSYRLHLMVDGRFAHTYSGCIYYFEGTGSWTIQHDTLKLQTEKVLTRDHKRRQKDVDRDTEIWMVASSVNCFLIGGDTLIPLANRVILNRVGKIKTEHD